MNPMTKNKCWPSISRRSDLQPTGPRAQAGHLLALQVAAAHRLGRGGPAARRLPGSALAELGLAVPGRLGGVGE